MRNNFLGFRKQNSKIFWHIRINLLWFWVVENEGYPETNVKLRQKFKIQKFLIFFLIFIIGSSLPQRAPFLTTLTTAAGCRLAILLRINAVTFQGYFWSFLSLCVHNLGVAISKDIFHGYFWFVVIANLYENVIPILGRFHKRFYKDNTIRTSLVHGQQRVACWFRDSCTRVIRPRLWRNTLISVYVLAQGSIWSNC